MSFYGQVVDAEKLRQERDQWKDEALRLREQKTMHMYVWSDEVSFMAIAQAESVQKARLLVLDQIGTDDGSCPERVKARRVVETITPGIWYGSNAEFCLRDNAEIREQEAYSAKLFAENEALRKRLESATDFDFGTHTVYFNQRKKWMAYVGGRCVKCLLGIGPKEPTEVSTSCGFDTFEEADAAALKALEVAG